MNLTLSVERLEYYRALFGAGDEHMRLLTAETGVRVALRDTQLTLNGEPDAVALVATVINKLLDMLSRRETVDTACIRYVLSLAREGQVDRVDELSGDVVATTFRGRPVKCKTLAQRQYVQSIRSCPLTFGIGPAGTGKTFLAMAMAVTALKNKEAERIVLTRPAVEAGEKLGFLPGDLTQKVDPYLRPLYDALYDLAGSDAAQRLLDRGAIEIAPLAYMRGRTLSDAFIILDEAQNTTSEQMKMFLTRMGLYSRMVVTGDVTQIDLPPGRVSGLVEAAQVLQGVPGIGVVALTHRDVVRHELVLAIVRAYEERAAHAKEEARVPIRAQDQQ
ncbi:MAG: PhoH family protein [Oscillospiraceae bacterium]|jgi:phosphate starvation-inducible PhoH-like protein|nr:PhoH family protein [Oscillospiraceae bacterium]